MKKEDVVKQFTTPIGAPAFTHGPLRFLARAKRCRDHLDNAR